MALSDIVNVVITSNSRGVTRASFGVAAVYGYHTNWYDVYKSYSLGTVGPDLVADGFTTYDPIYRACTALARNTPKSNNVIVGRLTTAFTQQFTLTVLTAATEEGKVITFTVVSPDGTTTDISYTVLAAATTTTVAAALALLITAVADLTSASVVAVITTDADNAGEMFYVTGLDEDLLTFADTTADSNLAAEIGAIQTKYPNTYGTILADPNSSARVTAIAAMTETQERIFGYTTHDAAVGDGASTTDIFYTLNASSYFRTFGMYSADQGTYAAAVWMGNRFPIDAGSSTWAFKPLSGVAVDSLSSSFTTAIKGKKGNYYVDPGSGSGNTFWGYMASGEWIDAIRGRDWLVARLRERIVGHLQNAPKIPFTQPGAESLGNDVDAQIKEGIGQTYLSGDAGYTVTVPDVSTVSDANKIARTLPDISFEATLAGAIHIVDPLNGVLKV
jgi:hypothetical protein